MLHIDTRRGGIRNGRLVDVLDLTAAGDVWVLNDAATIPASLRVVARGRSLELRLAQATRRGTWWAVLFGEGSWRDDTDLRPAPPRIDPGERLWLGDGSSLTVVRPPAGRLQSGRSRADRLLEVASRPPARRSGSSCTGWGGQSKLAASVRHGYRGHELGDSWLLT